VLIVANMAASEVLQTAGNRILEPGVYFAYVDGAYIIAGKIGNSVYDIVV
jgi:hypothetical protein